MKLLRKLAPVVGLVAVLAAPQAQAALGDSLFATGGDIVIRFEGSDAGYDSRISVNGSGEIFPNHATLVGAEADLGSFAAGTLLDVVLHVINTGNFFHSGNGAINVDGLAHAVVTAGPGGRTFVSFEDLVGGGDHDFNDHMFSFTNVSVGMVPEPTSLALTLAGLGVLGFFMARRRDGKR
jgi:hypothetical protein